MEFVGIVVQDTERNARAFVKEFNMSFPVGYDDGGLKIARSFGFVGMPLTIFVSKRGEIAERVHGPLPESDLVRTLDQLLKEPATP